MKKDQVSPGRHGKLGRRKDRPPARKEEKKGPLLLRKGVSTQMQFLLKGGAGNGSLRKMKENIP